eukprot:CAMPEP_0197612476 /NCGR_PEP_ID=MMETSP1326-20131121/57379_1 /TAXON_ID=1155430 /ORGANISM="Genus nov. species nov., Strain RCC2288" /LENGTH=91 /DNA_ID=CAMNT_0043181237 /DNA_START=113 /DNA_END=385 /DNA_ORIENTATION=+
MRRAATPGSPGSGSGREEGPPAPALEFAIRLVTIDYYLAKPVPGLDATHSAFVGAPVDRVPIVRIFGETPGGQKACLHLHRAFPYFYVPYD